MGGGISINTRANRLVENELSVVEKLKEKINSEYVENTKECSKQFSNLLVPKKLDVNPYHEFDMYFQYLKAKKMSEEIYSPKGLSPDKKLYKQYMDYADDAKHEMDLESLRMWYEYHKKAVEATERILKKYNIKL